MSHNATESSQTVSSGEIGGSGLDEENQTILLQCIRLVSQYWHGTKSKAEAVITIQGVLSSSSVASRQSDQNAFAVYLDMLDHVDSERADARRRGEPAQTRESSPGEPAENNQPDRPRERQDDGDIGRLSRQKERDHREVGGGESDDDEEGEPKKRRPTVDESLFPWRSSSQVVRIMLSPGQQEVLELLDNWANDPTFVVRKILLSPGCPNFPPDQWLQLVKGLAVDLNKVLGAHYSTEVDSKQTQDLGDVFQLSVKLPRQMRSVQTHGEWVIAFSKTIQAISYILPPRRTEYLAWETYISQLFTAVQSSHHERVIEFD